MLAQQIQIRLTQRFADSSTITIGDNATVASAKKARAVRIEAADIEQLLAAAAELLQPDGVSAFAHALRKDGELPAAATRTFLDRVKTGAVGLLGGVTSNAAYDSLVVLLKRAFPGSLDWLPGGS
jgi:hypothetical protein